MFLRKFGPIWTSFIKIPRNMLELKKPNILPHSSNCAKGYHKILTSLSISFSKRQNLESISRNISLFKITSRNSRMRPLDFDSRMTPPNVVQVFMVCDVFWCLYYWIKCVLTKWIKGDLSIRKWFTNDSKSNY